MDKNTLRPCHRVQWATRLYLSLTMLLRPSVLLYLVLGVIIVPVQGLSFPFRSFGPTTVASRQALSGSTNSASLPNLYEASVVELQNGLESGAFTSVDLIKARPLLLYTIDDRILNNYLLFRRILLVLKKSTLKLLHCEL